MEVIVSTYGKNWKTLLQLVCDINLHRAIHLERKNQWLWFKQNAGSNGNPTIVEKFLFNNGINFKEFTQCVKEVLDLSHKKINALYFYGTPNSGKTMLANLIIKVFNARSILKNGDSVSSFYYEPIINSSIVLIEEPFIIPINLEDMKILLGAGELQVNVKYQPLQRTVRIPYLITSNFPLLSRGYASSISEKAIKTRVHMFKFSYNFKSKTVITSADLLAFFNKYE